MEFKPVYYLNVTVAFYLHDCRVRQKTGPQTHDHNSVRSKPIFKKNFTGRFLDKFAVKWILKIPPHLALVATLPCETLMSAKQAVNERQIIR